MFEKIKKLIAVILLVAMVISNSGMSVFAVSISSYIETATENAPDDSDITYRYYEEYNYSKTTYLMNDSEDDKQSETETSRRGNSSEPDEEETTLSEETNETEARSDEQSETESSDSGAFSETDVASASVPYEDEETKNDDYDIEPEEDETEASRSDDLGEADIASASEIENETQENEEEFGTWQDEKDVASVSEIEEKKDLATESEARSVEQINPKVATASEVYEINIASVSDIATLSEANVASGSEINLEDLVIATESIAVLPVASESDVKLFGATPRVGSTVFFGTYPQANDSPGQDDPIEWYVISQPSTNQYRLLAKHSLDALQYNSRGSTTVTWETSDIRKWANETFYNRAFNDAEKEAIVNTTVVNGGNTGYNTTDKVFLLSESEYSSLDEGLQESGLTGYLKAKWWYEYPWYWLRTMYTTTNAKYVYISMFQKTLEDSNVINTYCFRPCITVNGNSALFRATEYDLNLELGGGVYVDNSPWESINKYKTGYVTKLPRTSQFKTRSDGLVLDGWKDSSGNLYREIPTTQTGNLTLTANWIEGGLRKDWWDLENSSSWRGPKLISPNNVTSIELRTMYDPDVTTYDDHWEKYGYHYYLIDTKVVIRNADGPTIKLAEDATETFGYSFEFTTLSTFGSLTEIKNLSCLDTSNTTNMTRMFYYCESLRRIDLSGFNTSKVTDFTEMFSRNTRLTAFDINYLDTSKATTMHEMFNYCTSLTSIDLTKMDTSNVTDMSGMFKDCHVLEEIDVSRFNTSNVTDMTEMFRNCLSVKKLDLSNFDTSNVTSMKFMFHDIRQIKVLDLRNFDTRKVTNMYGMFYNSRESLETILVGDNFSTAAVTEGAYMFFSCYKLVGGKRTTYSHSSVDVTYARVDKGPTSSSPGYFTRHIHKDCGLEDDNTCRHQLYQEIHENIEWDYVTNGISTDDFKALLETTGEKHLFLLSDVGTEGSTEDVAITLRSNINLCLNGFSLHNIRFEGNATNYKVTITNCYTETSNITERSSDLTLFDKNHVNILGVNQNIKIKANLIFSVGAGSGTGKKANFFETTLNPYVNRAVSRYCMYTVSNTDTYKSTINLENSTITGFNSSGVLSGAVDVTLKDSTISHATSSDCLMNIQSYGGLRLIGTNNIFGNTHTGAGGMISISSHFNIEDGVTNIYNNSLTNASNTSILNLTSSLNVPAGTTLSVNDNMLTKSTNDQRVVYIDNDNSSILGNFEIRNNKFVNATGTATNIKSGLVTSGNSITVGEGLINVSGNKVYSDARGTTVNEQQYVIEAYAYITDNTTPFFKQQAGTKFSKNSKIGSIGFSHADGYGVVMAGWRTNAEVKKSYIENIIADKNRKENVDIGIKGQDLIVSTFKTVKFYTYYNDEKVQVATEAVALNYHLHKEDLEEPKDPSPVERIFLGWALNTDENPDDVLDIENYIIAVDTELYAVYENHYHKVCGVASGSACTHTLVTDTHDAIKWTPVEKDIEPADFRTLLQASGSKYLYLLSDIGVEGSSTHVSIVVTDDVHICLNGFSMHNIRFGANTSSRKVTITNCLDTHSLITESTAANDIFNKNNVNVFGIDKNITIKAHGIYAVGDTTSAQKTINFYSAHFEPYNASAVTRRNIYTNGTSESYMTTINVEGCEFDGFNSQSFVYGSIKWTMKDTTIQNTACTSNIISISEYGSFTLYGDNNVRNCTYTNNESAFYINADVSIENGTTTFENNKNTGNSQCFVDITKSFDLKADARLIINNNTIKKANNEQKILSISLTTNILGSLAVTNNKFTQSSGTSTNKAIAFTAFANTVTLGSKAIVIRNNDVYTDEAGTIRNTEQHVYQIYSTINNNSTALFTMEAGAKFSKDSYIEGIAFSHTDGHGYILKDWDTLAEDKESYRSNIFADKFLREAFLAAVKDGDLIVNVFYIVDFIVKDNSRMVVVATQGVLENYYIKKATTPSDVTGRGRIFMGWSLDEDGDEGSIIDIYSLQINEDKKLYAVFRSHIHKVCAIPESSACTHGGNTHANSVSWMSLTEDVKDEDINDYLNGRKGDFSQYICLQRNITLNGNQITLTRNLNICLNGYSITGSFEESEYKLLITNCQSTVSKVGDVDSAVFNKLSFDIYGMDNGNVRNINIVGGKYIDLNTTSSRQVYIYNATFVKKKTNVANNEAAIYIGKAQGRKEITFDHISTATISVSESQYTNTHFIYVDGHKDNTILNFRDVSISGYTSYQISLMDIVRATVNFYGTNNMSHSTGNDSTIDNSIIRAFGTDINVIDGKLALNNNRITSSRLFALDSDSKLTIAEAAELEMTNNKQNKTASYQAMLYAYGKIEADGKIRIENNKVVLSTGVSNNIASALYVAEAKSITIGNKPIILNNNFAYEDEDGTVRNTEDTVFALFSYATDFNTPIFIQKAGTKFSKDSVVNGVGFEGDRAFGYIIKNWNENTAENYEDYKNVFTINTFRNEGKKLALAKYKGDIVIARFYNVEFMYDANSYIPSIATQSVFANEYIERVATPAYIGSRNKYFAGWATKSNATEADVIDIYSSRVNEDLRLFAVYEEHKHKICGLDFGTPCAHIEIGTHTDNIDFDALTNEYISKNGFPKSGNYYLREDITVRAFVQVTDTLNLCLNGYKLNEVRFSSDNESTINITNCDDNSASIKALTNPEASTTRETYALFNTMNVNVIAAKGAIDINADHVITTEYVSEKQDQLFYNVNFSKVTSTIRRGAVFKLAYATDAGSTLRIIDSKISDYSVTGNNLFDFQNVMVDFENATIADNTTNNSLFNNAGNLNFLYTTIERNVATQEFIRSIDDNSVINIHDGNEFKDNTVGGYFIHALNGITFDGTNTIKRNAFNNNGASRQFIWTNANGRVVFVNGTNIISENTDAATGNSPNSFIYTESDLLITNSAKLVIKNNTLRNSATNYSIIHNAHQTNLMSLEDSGSLEITDNQVQQNAPNNNIKAAIFVPKNKKINVSSGSIIISGNDVIGSESGNTHMYGVYSAETDMVSPIFNQTANKFNKLSLINSIAFAGTVGYGRVIDNWTEETAEDVDSYRDIFIPDLYGRGGRNLAILHDKNEKYVAIGEEFLVRFLFNSGSETGIASQSILGGKKIAPVASPSDPTGRGRAFIGWATKSNATLKEVIDTLTYEIYEDTNFYTVFQLFEEHKHKICGLYTEGSCMHNGVLAHVGFVEYEALTSVYIRRHGFPTSGNFFLFEDLTITTEVTVSDTLNLCLNGKTLNFVKFTSSDRKEVNIGNCQVANASIRAAAGEILFDGVVPKLLSVGGPIDIYADSVMAFENATSVDRIESLNIAFRPVSSSVTRNVVFGTSYSTENGSRVFIASSSISNYNLTSGSLILNHNNTWFAQKLYIYNNDISAHMLNNEGSFTMTEVIASANIIHLNAIQNNVTGASITYRGGTVFANNKFYRQYLYNSREITYNGDISFINNEYNLGSDDYAFMHSNYTSATTFINGTVLFDGNKDMTTNNRASSGFLYFEAGLNVYNSTKIIIRNNKFVKTTGSQSIFTIQSGGSFLTLTGTAQIRIEDNEYRQDINTDSLVTAFYVRAGQQITMANSSFYIKNNRITGSYSDRNHMYGLYSGALNDSTPIFVQMSGNFSDENYIDSVAFGTESGFGVITENYVGTENPVELAKRIVADPYKRHSLKTIIDGNRLIIGDAYTVEFKYDKNTYIPTIATQSVLAGEFVQSVASPSDPHGKGRKFFGWATKSNATADDLVELTTYVLEADTVFYAVFESHMHSICGVSTTSCTHTLMPDKHDSVIWREIKDNATLDEFKAEMEETKEKYLYLISDIGDETGTEYQSITLTADTYLCLNGYSIHNIRFNQTEYKLVITNCNPKVSSITRNTDDGTIFNSVSTDIYGRNNNIVVKGFSVYNNTQNSVRAFNAYSVLFTQFDNSVEANHIFTTSSDNAVQLTTMKFEKVDISGFNANVLFNRAVGVTLKNVKIHNNKFERTIFDITANGSDLTLLGNIDIYENETLGGIRSLINNAKNTIIETLATLSVVNNKLERAYQDQKFLEFKNGDKILGALYVVNNKYVSASGSSNNISAAVYLPQSQSLSIATSSIIIRDNDVYTDAAGNTKNTSQKVYQLYSASNDNSTPIFTQIAGTKFNTNSYIGGIGFAHTEGLGHIIDNWTAATTLDVDAYERIFIAETFRREANQLATVLENNNVIITAVKKHTHTICGVASASCTHSLVSDKHQGIVWSGVADGITPSEFKTLLEENKEKYIYLDSHIGTEGSGDYTEVTLTADTYICLNGFSMHNIRFNQTAFKLVITNCQNTVASITRDTETENMFNSNNIDIYGVNKNIVIKGYGIYNNAVNETKTFNAYSVKFTQYNSNVVGTQVFSTEAENAAQLVDMKLENVDISGFNVATIFSKTLSLTFKNVDIHDNKMSGTIFNAPSNILIEKVATLSIINNKMVRAAQEQKFVSFKNGDKVLGSLIVKNNKFVSAAGTNTNLMSAVHMAAGQSLVVGDGKIVIDNNDVYTDADGNTKNNQQHVYQLYSGNSDNSTPIFVQDSNTKFSAKSFINGIRFNHTYAYGHIINNWNDNTAEDRTKIAQIFKADVYGRETERLSVAMDEEGNDVIIYSTLYVEFFLSEGVYVSDVATQSVVRNGKVMPATPSLIVGAVKFLGWATSLEATHFWDYENDRINADTKLYAIFLTGEIHLHKACGISSGSTCLVHNESDFGDHSANVYYESVVKLDMVDKLQTIAVESEVSVYLAEDIISDTPVVIYLGNATNGTRANPAECVINICLNGHVLRGYTFVTRNKNVQINITNCQNTISTITNTSNDAFAKGGTYTYTQGVNTYTSSSRVDLRLFGSRNNNLKLVSDKIVGFTSATTTRYSMFAADNVVFNQNSNANNKLLLDKLNVAPYIYNSVFDGFTNVDNIMTRQSGNGTYKLKDTVFRNISATNTLFENATLDVSGEVKIENSSATRNMLSANISVHRMATLSVINNRLTRNVAGNAFINMTNSTSMNVLGGLVVRNNRVEGCNATNNQEVIAAINLNNRTMTVGTGSIIVRDNTSDGNDSTHANHHMYGIYSAIQDDSTAMMTQANNTKHSKGTYIDSIAFSRAYGFGHIINNWTKDTAEDINSYKNSFFADKFVHSDLQTSVYKNDLVIGNYTEFKVYFVSTISEVREKLATQSVVNRGTASEPDPVEVAGYVFKGWFKDRDYTEKFDFANTLITEDTPIYVKYEKTGPEVFKVVFVSTVSDAVIEAAIATQNVIYRGTASEPIVSYEGYDFLGWYTDQTYTTKFDFVNTIITHDTTIYARWRSNKFIVTLNARGGVFSNGRETKTEAIDVDEYVAFEEPTKDGYIFMYYEYNNERVHDKWDYLNVSNATLYARWQPITYTIVYAANGGQNIMPAQLATYGQTVRLKNNAFTKEGYTFNRWKLGNTTYANAAQVSNLTTTDRGFVTLEAEWTPATYTINYRGNGSTSGSIAADSNVAYRTNHTLKNNTFAKAQYTFNGWSLSENTQSVYGNQAVIDKSEEYRRTINLYASWILTSSIKGTIEFDGNGGLVDGVAKNTKYYAKGDLVQVPTLSREGYVFTGWTKDGSAYTLPGECNFEGTITLVANWRKAKYKIVYYANNNTDSKFESAEYEYDADVTIANINSSYTKDNYHFEYWSYGANDETKAFGVGDVTSKLSAVDGAKVELYAVWKGNNFNITFNGSNPTTGVVSSRSFAYGDNKSIPANTFAKTGYKFSGWTKTEGSDNIDYYNYTKADYIYETTNRTNITLYAVWVESSEAIDLVFDANGGNINGKTRIKAPLKPNSQITLPEPQSFGFTKSNWLNDDMTTAFDGTVVDFTEPKIIYANWNESTYTVHFVGSHADSTTTMDALVKRYSEEFELSDNRYERRGYKFVGWDVNADGKNVVYAPKQKSSKLADANANLRLYAVWEENTYIINYVEDGVAVASTSLLYTKTARLRPNAVPKAARDKGYEYTYSGGVKRFTSGQTVSLNDFEVTGSNREFNLVSKVEKAIYNIEFNPNGGTWEDGTTDVKVASISYGDRIVWPATPSFGNRKFNGYKVKGVLYTSETFDFDESVSFTADWDKAKCYIVFHKNTPVSPGGFTNEVKGNMATQSFIEGYDARIARNEFNVSGYTYIGWSTSPYTAEEAEALRDSESPLILKNTQIIDFPSRLDTTYHLYALWVRNKINITLAQNETNPTVADPYVGVYEVLYDQLLSEVPAFDVKTREGYTFTGKFTRARIANPIDKKNYNGTDYLTRDVVNRNVRDIILYPLWQNNEHRVTLNIGDGTLPSGYSNLTFTAFYDAPYNTKGVAGEPKQANGEIVTPIANSADERMFTYWSKDSAGNNKINGSDLYLDTTVNTFYANYKDRERFTIRFSPGDGSGTMGNQTFVEGIPQALSKNVFTRSGYYFENWKLSGSNVNYWDGQTVTATSDMVLEAVWKKESGGGGGSGGRGGGSGGAGAGRGSGSIGGALPSSTIPEEEVTDLSWNYNIILDSEIAFIAGTDINPTGWIYGNNSSGKIGWQYFTKNGVPTTGWYSEKGDTYYFDSTGIMVTGKVTVDGQERTFDSKGKLTSGALTTPNIDAKTNSASSAPENGVWSYEPLTNKWQYLVPLTEDRSEPVRNTWFESSVTGEKKWYATDANGYMLTGLVKHDGNIYFLEQSGGAAGSMVTNSVVNVGGMLVEIDASGKVVGDISLFENLLLPYDMNAAVPDIMAMTATVQTGWQIGANGARYYVRQGIDALGKPTYEKVTGIQQIDGLYYCFDSTGMLLTGLKIIDGKLYYLHETGMFIGSVATGFVNVNGAIYYCDPQNGGVATRLN